tara:strand:- start:146 stop:493 length:348 start_codon:yes stop_codon:yes gene_type:complete
MITDNLKITYVFDIDGTLCTLTDGDYEKAEPIRERIDKVNELYDLGHNIILNTARGMGRTDNAPIYAERLFKKLTQRQLEEWGVKYHRLFMGKPSGDVYIDDKGEKDEDFFNTRD